jgi:cytochrome P450
MDYPTQRTTPFPYLSLHSPTPTSKTAISMHAPLIHHSPIVYPEPWSFIPERWLPQPSSTSNLPPRPANIPLANPKYLVPFSKGTRHCIGQPLAHAEIYMTLVNVLRTFCRLERDNRGGLASVKGMRLYETDRRDVDLRADMGFASPEKGRGSFRVVLE